MSSAFLELHGGEARFESSRIRYTVSGFSNRIMTPRRRPSVFFYEASGGALRPSRGYGNQAKFAKCLAEECHLWHSLILRSISPALANHSGWSLPLTEENQAVLIAYLLSPINCHENPSISLGYRVREVTGILHGTPDCRGSRRWCSPGGMVGIAKRLEFSEFTH